MSDRQSKNYEEAKKAFYSCVSERTRSKRDAYFGIEAETLRTPSSSQACIREWKRRLPSGNNSVEMDMNEPEREIVEQSFITKKVCSASKIWGSTMQGSNKSFCAASSWKNVGIPSKKPSLEDVCYGRFLVQEGNDNEDSDSGGQGIEIIDKAEFICQKSFSTSKIRSSSKEKFNESFSSATPRKDASNASKRETSAGYCESFSPNSKDAFNGSDHAWPLESSSFIQIESDSEDTVPEDIKIQRVDEAELNSITFAKKANNNKHRSFREIKIMGHGEGVLKKGKSPLIRQGYSAVSSKKKKADIVKDIPFYSYCGLSSEDAGRGFHKEQADRSRSSAEKVSSDEDADHEKLGIEIIDESEFKKWRRRFVSEKGSSTCQEQDEEHIAATSAKNVKRVSKKISFSDRLRKASEKNDRNRKKRKASEKNDRNRKKRKASVSTLKKKGEACKYFFDDDVDSSSNELLCSSSSTESNSDDVNTSLGDSEVSSYGSKQEMNVGIANRTRSKMGSIKKASEVGNVLLGASVASDSSPTASGCDSSLDEDFEVESSDDEIELLSSHVEACEVQEENEEKDRTFHYDDTDAEEGLKEKNNLEECTFSEQSNTQKGCDEMKGLSGLHPKDQSQTETRRPKGVAPPSHSKDDYDHSSDDNKERTEATSSDLLVHGKSKASDMVNETKVLTGPKEAAPLSHLKDGYDHSHYGTKEKTEVYSSVSLVRAKNKTADMADEKVSTGAKKAAPPSHSKDGYDHSGDGNKERTEANTSDSHVHAKNKPAGMANEKKVPTGPKKAAPPSHSKFVYDHTDDGTKEITEAANSDSHDHAMTEAADIANERELPMERKQVPSKKLKDLCTMLADAVLGSRQIPESKETYEETKKAPAPDTQNTLPLKFRFEDEVPEQVEKTEYEKEIDSLFYELDCEWKLDELKSFDFPKDNLEIGNSPPGETQHARCSRGKHELVLEDDEGLICIFCHHVELGPKDVMPEWAERTWREPERKKCLETEQLLEFDEFQLDHSTNDDADVGNSSNATDTVWSIKPGVRESMYEHQREGFEFLWENLAGSIYLDELKSTDSVGVGGCIISHAPGTGKTRLTMVFVETYFKMFPSCRPVIISPASTLLTWEEEFRKWKVEFPFHNLSNLELSGKENRTALGLLPQTKIRDKEAVRMIKICSWSMGGSILGISYNLFEKLTGERNIKVKTNKKREALGSYNEKMRKILLEKPGLVVLDEGHTPRNQRSSIWNVLLKLQTVKRVILSGTPFQNNFGELFNTLRIVRPTIADVLAQEKTFSEMFVPKRMSSSRQHRGEHPQTSLISEDVDRAVEYLKGCISPFVHLHKGTILQQSLPGLRDCVVLLKPPALQKSLIERLEGSNNFKFEHEVALISVHPYLFLHCEPTEDRRMGIDMGAVGASRLNPQEGVKTRFLLELLRLSMAVKEKVLVFSQYIQPLECIKEQLKETFKWVEGKQILHMKGKQYQKQRQYLINLFNDPQSESKIMLASTKCCSEGISLVGASRVVLLDVVWNPSVERQAICRAYRIGQKKFVYTYHLMTAGTTEADKYCRQAEKERLSELVFSSLNECNQQKHPSLGIEDRILEVMIAHDSLKGMFEKIINQPKETDLIQTFGLTS